MPSAAGGRGGTRGANAHDSNPWARATSHEREGTRVGVVRPTGGRKSSTPPASSGGTSNTVGDSADGADAGAPGDQWQRMHGNIHRYAQATTTIAGDADPSINCSNSDACCCSSCGRAGGGTVVDAAAPSLCRGCGNTLAPGSDVGVGRRRANPLQTAPPPPPSIVGKLCPPCECTAQHHHWVAAIGHNKADATRYPSNITATELSSPGNGEKNTTDACSKSKIHAAVTTRAPFASITTKAPPSLSSDSSKRVTTGGRRPASATAAAKSPQSAIRTARARRLADGLSAFPPSGAAGSGILAPCRRVAVGTGGRAVGGVVVSVAAVVGAAAAVMTVFEKHRVAVCFLR